MKQHNKPRKS